MQRIRMLTQAIVIDPQLEQVSALPTSHDPTIRFFWVLIAVHVAVWMAVCLLTQPNMPLDMVEMLYWGQQWQLGYHKHPPLPAWTAATAWSLGGNHPWMIYLVAQLTIASTFWAVWQTAREALTPWIALSSVVLLEACYYCTYMINDINNTIMTRPFWALAILFLYRALSQGRNGNGIFRRTHAQQTAYWCAAGAAIGLGMLCKYYIAVLVIAMMMIPVLIPDTRKCLKTRGPWLMTGIALLLFAPHLIWMVQNDFITIRYVFNRSAEANANPTMLKHITSPLAFIGSQAGAILPMLIIAWPLWTELNSRRKIPATDTLPIALEKTTEPDTIDSPFFLRYLQIVVFGPIAAYLLVALLLGATIRSMWGGPLFSFLGLLLFAWIRIADDHRSIRKMLRNAIMVGIVMAIALTGRNMLGPVVRDKLSKVHFPGRELSKRVNECWSDRYQTPLPVAGGEMFVAGCVGVYSPESVDVYGYMSPSCNPWLSDKEMDRRGGVIVWDYDRFGELPPDGWLERFSNVEVLQPIACQTQPDSTKFPVNIGIAIVHPFGESYSSDHDIDSTALNRAALELSITGPIRANIPTNGDTTETTANRIGTKSPIRR